MPSMNVAELIHSLRALDPDGNCMVYTHDGEGHLVALDPCNLERVPVVAHDCRTAVPVSGGISSDDIECVIVL